MKKKRNYMFKFGLSFTIIPILPIEIIVWSIFLPINYINGNIDIKDIFINIGIMFIILFGVFILISLIAFGMMKLSDIDKLEYKDNKISNGFMVIKEEDIKYIKASRFLFIYYFAIFDKLWFFNSSMSYYFYNKDELKEFLNDNSFLLKHVREKDLKKLGINKV